MRTPTRTFQQAHIAVRLDDITPPIQTNLKDYTLNDLIPIKERLCEAKSLLDPIYVGSKTDQNLARVWMNFQNIIDTYKPMRAEIRNVYGASNVTNAWMKYWEIYSEFGLIPDRVDRDGDTSRPYMAFFNAELPGAALCAFNHYMKTARAGMPFDWRASSLAPSNDSTALGDTYGIWEMNKSRWLMDVSGAGNNGDATVVENVLDFAAKVGPASEFGGVDLYSHDAGMSLGDDELNFNKQESINAKLHFGCALTGLLTLRPGGCFIAKQYTFFETFTWNLILIYASMFDEFYISKPLTSRPYNSEIYLVGKGFRGISDELKNILIERLRNFDETPMIPCEARHIIGSQISKINEAARLIFIQQINLLRENVKLFNAYRYRIGALRAWIEPLKAEKIKAWFTKYPMVKIAPEDELKKKK